MPKQVECIDVPLNRDNIEKRLTPKSDVSDHRGKLYTEVADHRVAASSARI